jgi:hypothetical protein
MIEGDIGRFRDGNMVWCRNGDVCAMAAPCDRLACAWKHNESRPAKNEELKACNSFQITTVSGTWDDAARIYPR